MSRSQRPACPDRRDTLVDVASDLARRDASLEAHLIACDGCRDFLASVEAQRRAFRDLARKSAPRELDGYVVAALQAGHRQDRAIEALRSLERMPMPLDADLAIWPAGAVAPAALDRLVERDLQDPTHSIARRFAGRIERLQAPRELETRVATVIALSGKRRRRAARGVSLALAALGLVGLSALGTWFFATRPGSVVAAGPKFVVEHVHSASELDPLLGSTLASLLGGLPDAEVHLKKEKL